MTVFISGPITGVPDYRRRFAEAEARIQCLGYETVNPADLPFGMPYNWYLLPCLQMLAGCDAIYMLPGWENSKGARLERAFAEAAGIPVIN